MAQLSQHKILDDEDFQLTIDKANYFAFKMDDIEEAHSHVNFMQLATDRAAYRLSDQYDQDVLGYLSGFKQSALHGSPDTANTTVNGSKSVINCWFRRTSFFNEAKKVTSVTSQHHLQGITLSH